MPCEVLVVYDSLDDTTRPYLEKHGRRTSPGSSRRSTPSSPGPAHALRYGFSQAKAAVVVVTMADGSDDPQPDRAAGATGRAGRGRRRRLALHATAASRSAARRCKGMLSRVAGVSLYWLARVGTHDATNSFKAYDRDFVERGRHRVRCRLRDRPRAGGQGAAAPPPGGRDPDHLARSWHRPVELQGASVDPPIPALVPLRVRTEAHVSTVLVSGSAGFIGGYVVQELLAAATRSSASTTTRSTGRWPAPTTTTPTTGSSRATPATSTS